MFRSKLVLPFPLLIIFLTSVEPKCPKTCDLALASYNVWPGATLTFISNYVFAQTINETLSYNPQITNENYILSGFRINVPFTCDCIGGEFLGHVFRYRVQSGDDSYDVIAETYYANLTTAAWLEGFNVYGPGQIPANAVVNVTVNCSCGDAAVSRAYGLFVTYPLGVGDSLESIAAAENVSEAILQRYNPGVDFSAGSGLVYIPGRDESGNYPPLELESRTGFRSGQLWNRLNVDLLNYSDTTTYMDDYLELFLLL
ncbi:lysM domain receptor-like kinase 3 [Rhododendron vialii]|uniref:lysM domain receptor-like kinase 3 n=1 Tax=Rhododendron vialii TaxID=182163 RepID=UPI002660552A|nr:lysM domain receptor-like kinase 3 [Rhododendron vialii]